MTLNYSTRTKVDLHITCPACGRQIDTDPERCCYIAMKPQDVEQKINSAARCECGAFFTISAVVMVHVEQKEQTQ